MIRQITPDDLTGLLELYLHLHETSIPPSDETLQNTWKKILVCPDYHIVVAEENGKIISSCTCLIVPNLTHRVRPYAVIENVVTHTDYRGRGIAGQVLHYAKTLAQMAGCYKIMLQTTSKSPAVHTFYQKAGYRSENTAFCQEL